MTSTTISPAQLPAPIRDYLDAHTRQDTDAALAHFGPDAVVTDQGETFRGLDEIRDFLTRAGSEFTYTTELTGAERIDDTHGVARVRLEGDFPGGVADLAYRFTLRDGRIVELFIGA